MMEICRLLDRNTSVIFQRSQIVQHNLTLPCWLHHTSVSWLISQVLDLNFSVFACGMRRNCWHLRILHLLRRLCLFPGLHGRMHKAQAMLMVQFGRNAALNGLSVQTFAARHIAVLVTSLEIPMTQLINMSTHTQHTGIHITTNK